jgi:serine acetyltransferase
LTEALIRISLKPKADIGLGHAGGIIVGSGAHIRANCNPLRAVTLDVDGRREKHRSPPIGDGMLIGPGEKNSGTITIGQAVVTDVRADMNRSLPDRAVALRDPARIVTYAVSFDSMPYSDEEQGAARIDSLKRSASVSDKMGDTEPDR